MTAVLRRTVLHCVAAALLVVTAMLLWRVPAAAASDLPREADGTIAAAPIGAYSGDGGCSSPLGETRWGFATACELHDHRYDLLRQAAARGTPLSHSARRAADAAFAARLDMQCDAREGLDATGCRVAARLYSGAIAANSWRQRYGPPLPEPALPWLAGTGVAVVVATSLGLGLAAANVRQPATSRRSSHGVTA
jgi:hypothetical protein